TSNGHRHSWAPALEHMLLPPLAKGSTRHRAPTPAMGDRQLQLQASARRRLLRHHLDLEAAEAYGQKLLGEDSWVERLFVESDGPACDYLWPAEFAALGFRFEQALGGMW
ncbi:unnamed protein product, partial [Symbiodinium microadriaticum]